MAGETAAGDGHKGESRWRRQAGAILETQITRYPFLVQGRAVLRQLEHERESWPLLIPLLLVVFFLTYRKERRKLLAVARELRD
jgi:hypothetical protein